MIFLIEYKMRIVKSERRYGSFLDLESDVLVDLELNSQRD